MTDPHREESGRPVVEMPASTHWPFVAAFGAAFVFGGIVTTPAVSAVGAVVLLVAGVAAVREVLPHERTHLLAVAPEPAVEPVPARPTDRDRHRLRLPVEVHPYSAGLWGGAAGAVAMAGVALLYGIVGQGGPWYPINLAAAVVVPSLARSGAEGLRVFSAVGLALASVVHGMVSLLVGLLYAVLLPMLPGSPLLWGAVVAPLLWSGGLWALLPWIDPRLAAGLSWPWFVASQVAFGLACGLVVSRSEGIRTLQTRPLADRAGLERGDGAPPGDLP